MSYITNVYLHVVERLTSFEFSSDEYGRLARKVAETLLESGEPMTDEQLAISLNISVAEVRRILQFLTRVRVLGVSREMTDDYRYEYRWYVNENVMRNFIAARAKVVVEKLSMMLRGGMDVVYYCPTCFRRYNNDDAAKYELVCPICGAQLLQLDRIIEVESITNIVNVISKALEELGKES